MIRTRVSGIGFGWRCRYGTGSVPLNDLFDGTLLRVCRVGFRAACLRHLREFGEREEIVDEFLSVHVVEAIQEPLDMLANALWPTLKFIFKVGLDVCSFACALACPDYKCVPIAPGSSSVDGFCSAFEILRLQPLDQSRL